MRQLAQNDVRVEDVSASFQRAVIDILVDRTQGAMAMFREHFPGANTLVVAGGVAANQAIGAGLARLCAQEDFALRIPPPRLCTDNAAMIAWAGVERLSAGVASDPVGVASGQVASGHRPYLIVWRLRRRARWPLAGR